MDGNQGEQYAMSLRLSTVLEDIGINRKMVEMRRQTWLVNETHFTVHSTIFENKTKKYFHFGSQSEGTTTLGMNSDIDRLGCEQFPVLLDSAEWQTSQSGYLLMLKNKQSPPQHCNLQLLGDASSQMLAIWEKLSFQEMVDVDIDGRELLKNTIFYSHMKKVWGDIFIKKGPSITINKNFDMVDGYCPQLPMECQFLFNRPRPGHYPRPEILSQARQNGVFLLPQGHAESSYPQLEWRYSTSCIERLLMFDLDIKQIKVYTFLQILRKTYFNPVFGDKLSTFHFKTAFMFTLETYPPSIWKTDNLLQCVIYCLNTLRRWCRVYYCPHYTISDVNLFVGKISRFEMAHISSILSDMIDNLPDYVVTIEMDDIGKRILELPVTGIKLSQPQTKPRYSDSRLGIWQICLKIFCAIIFRLFAIIETNETVEGLLNKFNNLVTRYTILMQDSNASFRDDYGFMVKLISSTSASVKVSMCIQTRQPISHEIYSLYQANMDSDLTSSRLKFASMLYCTGQYEKAAAMLDHTEGLLHPDVLQFCPGMIQFKPTDNFFCKAHDQPVSEVVRSSVALSVIFLLQELNCVPKHLVYEMYRTFTHADDLHNMKTDHHLTNKANIDSIPFLFYLQYLTHRELGKHEKKNAAKVKLFLLFLNSQNSNAYGYMETLLHMLGHCMELEGCLDLAWGLYSKSLKAMPNNNAAIWHMAIMLNKTVNQ